MDNRSDGKKYEGQWANGKQHGKGIITNAIGESQESEWVEGKRVKEQTDKGKSDNTPGTKTGGQSKKQTSKANGKGSARGKASPKNKP